MTNRTRITLIFLVVGGAAALFWLAFSAAGEEIVHNVQYTVNELSQLVVTYDLDGDPNRTYNVTLDISLDGGQTWTIRPEAITGDVGANVRAGKNKRIVWNVFHDTRRLYSENLMVRVIAEWETTPGGMVRIPGGTFMMGCVKRDRDCVDHEKPAHRVTLSLFYLDVHDVTVAEYAQCVNAGVCKKPHSQTFETETGKWAEFYNWNKPGRENHPVNVVNWNDANIYCRWQQKRLPTEAEFEYALRGGRQGNIYPWGNGDTPPALFGNFPDETYHRRFPDATWTIQGYDDGYIGTSPVCSFTRNAYGLCDISGNVLEWVQDAYEEGYYARSPSSNPVNTDQNKNYHVFRGGSWQEGLWDARASSRRFGAEEGTWPFDIGFRCARD